MAAAASVPGRLAPEVVHVDSRVGAYDLICYPSTSEVYTMKRKVPGAPPEEGLSMSAEAAAEPTGGLESEVAQNLEAAEVTEPEVSLMQTVENAAESVAEDVATVVEPARRRLGAYMQKAVFSTCYYASYGVVYGALSVARAVPMDNLVGRAIKAGAADARSDLERQPETVAVDMPEPLGA